MSYNEAVWQRRDYTGELKAKRQSVQVHYCFDESHGRLLGYENSLLEDNPSMKTNTELPDATKTLVKKKSRNASLEPSFQVCVATIQVQPLK